MPRRVAAGALRARLALRFFDVARDERRPERLSGADATCQAAAAASNISIIANLYEKKIIFFSKWFITVIKIYFQRSSAFLALLSNSTVDARYFFKMRSFFPFLFD